MDLGLRDATAVVVGGGRGMGLATAHCFAEDGARVAVMGRNQETLDGAAAQLREQGSPDAFGVVAMVAMMPLISIQIMGAISVRCAGGPERQDAAFGDTDVIELWEAAV